jgi:hypothetical protein
VFKAFAITDPKKLNGAGAIAALGAADRLLADPNVAHAQGIIATTMQLADAGHPGAQLGASVLQAAEQIRQETGVPMGQPVIPIDTSEQQAAVNAAAMDSFYQVTPEDVHLVTTAVAGNPKKKGLWTRLLDWLGIQHVVKP